MDTLLLRPEQAAEATNLSRSVIYELLRRGEIESIKIGRSRRITPTALQRFIDARAADGDA